MKKVNLTSYHRIIFIIIVLIATAQLAWWIIFQLSESTHFRETQFFLVDKEKELAEEMIRIKSLDAAEAEDFINEKFPHLRLVQPPSTEEITLEIKPEFAMWIERESRRRVRMFLSEGIFFTLLLFLGIWFQYYTLNKELSLSREKNNFVAATTHELKSPITSLQLSVETLTSMELDRSKQEKLLSNMLYDIQRLDSLIGNILAARKSLSKEKQYHFQDVDLSSFINQLLDSQSIRCEKEKLRVKREIEPDIIARVDQDAFQLIFSNLFDNAVKFSPEEKEITVRLKKQDKWAVLVFQDKGIGIEPEVQDKIFLKFYRGDDEMTRTAPGVGLGLFLVKELVKVHQGEIEVFSKGKGTGATFTIKLPLSGEFKDV